MSGWINPEFHGNYWILSKNMKMFFLGSWIGHDPPGLELVPDSNT